MNAVAKAQDNLPGMPAESVTIMDIISRASRDPDVDVNKLERLMLMAQSERAVQAKQAFGVAMKNAQDEMGNVRADAHNPQTKSKYASYGALDRAIRPIYTKHGFALTFDTGEGGPADHVRVICEVFHEAGHTRSYHFDMPADGKGAKGGDVMTKTHAAGSAMSYGQRYLLKAIFNIVVGDDDDGNSASGQGPVTSDQAVTIRELIDRTGADIERFCKFFKIEAVPDLPAKKYEEAITRLNLKAAGAHK